MTHLERAVHFFQFGHGLGIALALLSAAFVTQGPASAGQVAPTPAEQFVLQHLKTRGEADFNESDLKERTISHEFLEGLITGPATISAISAYGINLSNANIQGELNITNMSIPFPLRFAKCKFDGGIDFSYDTFAHDLTITESEVGHSTKGRSEPGTNALFIGTKVDGTLNLDGTYFYSAVNLTYAEIGSEFLSDDVHYESAEGADFDSLKTNAPLFFRKSHFAGRLNLTDAELFSLEIEDALPAPSSSSDPMGTMSLEINQAHIKHGFEMKNVSLALFQAGFMDVEGPTDFDNVVPLGRVDLNHSHFQNLTISGFDQWLKRGVAAREFRLDGLSFDGIEIPNAPVDPSAMRMLTLIDSCAYSPQPYLELERFLRTHGSPDKADETYIDMRRRERERLSFWKKPFDWMLDVLVGYGRRPWRSGFFALFLVCVGAVIFRKSRMEHDDEKCTDGWYNPFWFSLDLLSPIDLGVSKRWRAKSSLLRNYAQIHRVAGWVLIPLIAAAITGIIK